MKINVNKNILDKEIYEKEDKVIIIQKYENYITCRINQKR